MYTSEELLDPERIGILEKVMSTYGKYLEEKDEIRIGVEGDPCTRYRSAEEAPSAVVTRILERKEDGFLRFRAMLKGSDEEIELTNRSFDPESVWEVHPDYVDKFSDRVNGYRGEGGADISSLQDKIDLLSNKVEELENIVKEASFRGGDDKIMDMLEEGKAFRETMASTVRALAGDTLRVARGEPVEFVNQYVDRYDLALEDRASSVASFRGASKRNRGREEEKSNFREVTSDPDDKLTDDEEDDDLH